MLAFPLRSRSLHNLGGYRSGGARPAWLALHDSADVRPRYRATTPREDAPSPAVFDRHPQTGRAPGLRIYEHHVGDVEEALLLHDTAGAVRAATGLQVALLHPDPLYTDAILFAIHRENAALLAAI